MNIAVFLDSSSSDHRLAILRCSFWLWQILREHALDCSLLVLCEPRRLSRPSNMTSDPFLSSSSTWNPIQRFIPCCWRGQWLAGLNKLTVIIRHQSLYCTPVCCMLTRAKTLELTVHATRHNQPHAISTWDVIQFTSCQRASGMFAMLDCNITTSCDNVQVGVAQEWRVVLIPRVPSYTSVASLFLGVQVKDYDLMRGEPVACSTVLYSSSRLDPCLGSEISNIAQDLSN